MKLNELNRAPEAKTRKRVGRGPGSGMGKTSTRGQKGQKSRSGASIPAWFQGGQTPLYRRLPKRGFNNAEFRTAYATINLSDLNRFDDGDIVTPELLKEKGINTAIETNGTNPNLPELFGFIDYLLANPESLKYS